MNIALVLFYNAFLFSTAMLAIVVYDASAWWFLAALVFSKTYSENDDDNNEGDEQI